MKAAVHTRYGPPEVVRVVDVPTPVAKDNEVLVRVRATTSLRSSPPCSTRRTRSAVPWT